jgi:hypothetical protein
MDFSRLKKLESTGAKPLSFEDDQMVTGIVKVRLDDYHPKKVKVRTHVGARMMTVEFRAGDLREIQDDPQVETVAISQALPLQKLP